MNMPSELNYINLSNLELKKASLLTDDIPLLDALNEDVIYEWRKESIKLYQKDFIKYNIPFFK